MVNCLRLSKSCIWGIGLLASPLFGLPAVESRTGDPVVPSTVIPSERYPAAPRRFEPAYSSSSSALSAEDRATHLTLTQIEALQRELSELRGLVETQEHQIKQLKKSQQDLYIDLESRIKHLQGSGQPSPNKPSKPIAGVSTEPAVGPAASTPRPAAAITRTGPSAAGSQDRLSTANAALPKPAVAPQLKEASPSELKPVTSASSSSSAPAGDQAAYQTAYNLVRTKRYVEAISSLQSYLNRFPKTENAAAAHYWLGEVYLLQWQNDKTDASLIEKAFNEFSSITTQFPHHSKVMDATLKLGLIEFDRGNQAAAEQYLTAVKTQYPGTAAARLAETRLQQIASD